METNKMSDFVVKSEGHCFLCLSKISPHLTSVKVEPESDVDSSSIQAEQSVFYANHSLQSLSRYLKLNLGVVLKRDNKACHEVLKAKLERSTLTVSLCGVCETLNGRFSKMFQQLEKIQMEVNHCLGAIQGKLTKKEEVMEERLDDRLSKQEFGILETLRRETMKKCLVKLDRTTPRVRLRKLKKDFKLVTTEQSTSPLKVTKPYFGGAPRYRVNASVKTELDSQLESEASPQLDIELMNIKLEREAIQDSGGEGDGADSPDTSRDKSFQREHDDFFSVADKASNDDNDDTSTKSTNEFANSRQSSAIKIHFHRNPNTGKFKCSACDKEFASKYSVRTHYRAAHLKLKLFRCNICGKQFGHSYHLQTHHRAVHLKLKPYPCDECGKRFGHSAKLQIHQKAVHLKIKSHKCDHCGKLFGHPCNLKTHLQRIHLEPHEELKRHQCDICCKLFTSRWSLTEHHQTVHLNIKRHQCDQCSKKFSNSGDLKIHVENLHLNIIHACDQCGKQFTMKRNLRKHLNKVHKKR